MTSRSPTRPALVGLLLGLGGIVSYFVVALHFGAWVPWMRNSALPNLALVALGLGLSLVAARRALAARAPRRWLAPSLAAVNTALAGVFAWTLFGAWALPAATGPAIGAPAPDFALVDQEGRPARLADFRGAPLLLVFYRGHW